MDEFVRSIQQTLAEAQLEASQSQTVQRAFYQLPLDETSIAEAAQETQKSPSDVSGLPAQRVQQVRLRRHKQLST